MSGCSMQNKIQRRRLDNSYTVYIKIFPRDRDRENFFMKFQTNYERVD